MNKAFTLMEIVIVMVIMGIITLMTMTLSGTQLQKLQRKTVKDTLLTEYQQRYSKNLTSSLFAGERYDTMKISFTQGASEIGFTYFQGETSLQGETSVIWSGSFQDKFVIQQILTNPEGSPSELKSVSSLALSLHPYEISCKFAEDSNIHKIVVVVNIQEQELYCFSLSDSLCRMTQVECKDAWKTSANPLL
jgi:prepilin-type N-terminal cleavage/methylation domain-containing protein